MKNLFVLIFSFFITVSVFATSNNYAFPKDINFCNSSLQLILPNNGPFKVKIDGNVYNDLRSGAVLGDIPSGKRYLKIVQFRGRNNNVHYQRNPEKIILFEGYMIFDECQDITALVTPNNYIHIQNIVNRRPDVACQNFPVINLPHNEFIHDHYNDNLPYCNGCNAYHQMGACAGGTCLPNSGGNGNYIIPQGGNAQNGNNYYIEPNGFDNIPTPISNGAFNNFLKAVEDRSFDSQKFDVAQLGLEQNYFTTAQIRRLTEVFSFDNSRLKVAKLGYSRVVDPQNYTAIFDVFSFDSSVNKLVDFMRQNG